MNVQVKNITISKYKNGDIFSIADDVAIEEPLEISIAYFVNQQLVFKIISVTMRTPGHDAELSIGFLFTENIITIDTQIDKIETKGDNKICVFITSKFTLHIKNTERNFYTTSSCGVCGKASIEAIKTIPTNHFYPQIFTASIATLLSIKNKLNEHQSAFVKTGGIHACALYNAQGEQLCIYEDVGRHNALDKLIGHQYFKKNMPMQKNILLLSGRASFELIQKSAMANISIVCAIGAPSSLAISLAQEMDITLIGFLKTDSCNIYSGAERIMY
jgi:FdhD protein